MMMVRQGQTTDEFANVKAHWSFALGSKYGPRSAIWNIAVRGKDAYITTAAHAAHWHISLHERGQWHVKSHRRGKDQKIIVVAHERAVPASMSYKVGVIIEILDSCLRRASDVDISGDPKVWLDRPPYGGAIEIAIMHWDFVGRTEEWPGQSVGMVLLWHCSTGPTTDFLVLARALSPDHPTVIYAEAQRPPIKPVTLDSPERRSTFFSKTPAGSLCVYEYAID